jgi:hypothetical protein
MPFLRGEVQLYWGAALGMVWGQVEARFCLCSGGLYARHLAVEVRFSPSRERTKGKGWRPKGTPLQKQERRPNIRDALGRKLL